MNDFLFPHSEKPTNAMSRRIWENITQMEIGTGRAIPEGEQAIEKVNHTFEREIIMESF